MRRFAEEYVLAASTWIVLNRLLAEFEPTAHQRFEVPPSKVTAVVKSIAKTGDDDFSRFASVKSRSAVLAGVRQYLCGLDHEEVVVAFGRRHGSGARFDGLWRGVGHSSSVALTPRVLSTMEQCVGLDDGEVMIIHNHCANDFKSWWRSLFGWKPLPSSADRDLAFSHNAPLLLRLMRMGRSARFHWFLVDEGEIAEFFLPSVEKTLVALEGFVQVARANEGIGAR